jgi:tetratricopeptide (TPR) repeat protein
MPRRFARRVRRAAFLSCLAATSVDAQTLGTISFPNSGNAAAQSPFIRGMLFLHSFEYVSAAAAFREAQGADPGLALAYWGEAMTHTHQVWNEQNLAAAHAILGRLAPDPAARRSKAKTHREQMYMDAVEALYGEGTKSRRDTLFARAIERLTAAHPDDDEAKVFHALALLGLNQGVRETTAYMRAGAIAEEVLRRNADHPGAAHFVIHAFDDPVHAPLGLWAARLYSRIAPQAPHAQHMTSHIFVAMGMWDDVVSQNIVAAGHNHGAMRAGHYTSWLGYGYLQQGRYGQARKHLETVRANVATPARRGEQPSLVMMRAHYLIDSERWNDPVASWDLGAAEMFPDVRAADAFASGYAGLRTGDRTRLRLAAATLGEFVGGEGTTGPRVLALELRAALLADRGQTDSAIIVLREATKLEDAMPLEFGPPAVVKPTHEFLGEVLLGAGRAAEAQRAFVRALELAPGRSRSLLGLARAAAVNGDRDASRRAAQHLLGNWRTADADVPERSEMERLAAASAPDR